MHILILLCNTLRINYSATALHHTLLNQDNMLIFPGLNPRVSGIEFGGWTNAGRVIKESELVLRNYGNFLRQNDEVGTLLKKHFHERVVNGRVTICPNTPDEHVHLVAVKYKLYVLKHQQVDIIASTDYLVENEWAFISLGRLKSDMLTDFYTLVESCEILRELPIDQVIMSLPAL